MFMHFVVNNVGRSHEMPTDYVDTTQNEIDDILTINIHATLRMTSMVLPGMINRYTFVSRIPLGITSNNHTGNEGLS
jgi:short-subunit dehydrogenase